MHADTLPPLTQILNSVKQPKSLCLKTSKPVTRQAAPTRARPPSPSLAQDRCSVNFRQGYPELWRFCVVCDSQSNECLYGMMSGKQFKAVSTHPPSVLVFFFFSSFSFSFVKIHNLVQACYLLRAPSSIRYKRKRKMEFCCHVQTPDLKTLNSPKPTPDVSSSTSSILGSSPGAAIR